MYKYTGKPQTLTGLYYYGARWYNQSLGRFLTRDPNLGQLSNPQSLNMYVYVLNNPLRYADPTGRDSCWVFSWVCNTASSEVNTVWNGAVKFGTTAWNYESTGVNWVVNEWNTNKNFRTIVVSTAIIGVVVATGGLAAPVLVGMAIGAGVSGGLYAATCSGSRGGCSADGALAAVFSGAAMGALGGVAGPAAGTIVEGLGLSAGGVASVAVTGGLVSIGNTAIDLAGSKSSDQIEADITVSMLTAGIGNAEFDPKGMDTLAQAEYFSPSLDSFGRALMGGAEHTFNARMILQSDLMFSTLGFGVDELFN